MDEILKQILAKLNDIEKRIITLEEELTSYEDVVPNPYEESDLEVEDIIPKAVMLMQGIEKVTYSFLQHKLDCGYAKTVRVTDRLVELAIISPDESGIYYNVDTQAVASFLKKLNSENKWN